MKCGINPSRFMLRRAFAIFLVLVFAGIAGPAQAVPTLGLAPLLSFTSYKSPLSSIQFTGDSKPHVGLGFSAHLTLQVWQNIGTRIHGDAAYFPAIPETYQIPDNNPLVQGDGWIEINRSLETSRLGVDIMLPIHGRTYLMVGPTYHWRTWTSKEHGVLPVGYYIDYDKVNLSTRSKNSKVSVGVGIGYRSGRRSTFEARINFDNELFQVEASFSYLVPLHFLSPSER